MVARPSAVDRRAARRVLVAVSPTTGASALIDVLIRTSSADAVTRGAVVDCRHNPFVCNTRPHMAPFVHRLIIGLVATLALICAPRVAEACSCVGKWPTFDDVASTMPVVVVGVVTAQTGLIPAAGNWPAVPRAVELEIAWVAKGDVRGTSATAWDLMAPSSCGGAFSRTPAGTWVALALDRVDKLRGRVGQTELKWMRFKAPDHDLVLTAACADRLVILETEAEREKYVGRRYR
jgi:hypothetical protein